VSERSRLPSRSELMRRPAACLRLAALLVLLGLLAGCAGGVPGGSGGGVRGGVDLDPASTARPGTRVVGLEFLRAYENTADHSYYPLERVSGCAFSDEGTLIFCDESRGKVYGLDTRSIHWYEFDTPMARPYQPVDVRVDGFKVLVLDAGGGSLYRFDLSGAYQDQLLDVARIDPAGITRGLSFDVDRDGRMIIADEAQQQILLLDTFLSLHMRLGEPGSLDDQFGSLADVNFLPDGSILACDPGNSRLCWYGRLGFFEGAVGGHFDADNPFIAPRGLDSDRFGNIFVADPGAALVQVFDYRFRYQFALGRKYDDPGTPVSPVDVAVGPGDLLAVSDQDRSAILVYRIIYE
jgi:hypothetical protein